MDPLKKLKKTNKTIDASEAEAEAVKTNRNKSEDVEIWISSHKLNFQGTCFHNKGVTLSTTSEPVLYT